MPRYSYSPIAAQYASRYQGNPYAQARKSTTVKYSGSAKSTNRAMPQTRLNVLNRMYNQYVAPVEQQYAKRNTSKGYGKRQPVQDVTPVPGVHGYRPPDERQKYTPVLFGSPFSAGGYVGNTMGTYAPELLQYAQGKGYGKAPAQQGRGEQPLNNFDKPYLPFYARGWNDPAGFINMIQRQYYTIGVPKSRYMPPGTTFGYKYTDLPTGQTELPVAQQAPTGGGGGMGYYYGGGGRGGYRYGGGGSYDRTSPSGAAPAQARGANVQYAGGQQGAYQPASNVPQWYRKLLSWNF
jgi:hypothetical protein